jgi:hypothetical protein
MGLQKRRGPQSKADCSPLLAQVALVAPHVGDALQNSQPPGNSEVCFSSIPSQL